MKYYIPAGTLAVRWTRGTTVVLPIAATTGTLPAAGEEIHTDFAVTFSEEDRIGKHYLEWYMFKLPMEASPWARMAVRSDRVVFV